MDDPSLLRTISEEEMREWAAEAPYAGLIQRLLAQKLAMEAASGEDQEQANVLAILSNVNPHQTIRSIEDFKKFMLTSSRQEEEKMRDETDELEGVFNMENEEVEDQVSDGEIDERARIDIDVQTPMLGSVSGNKEAISDVQEPNNEQVLQEDLQKVISRNESPSDEDVEGDDNSGHDLTEFAEWLESLQSLESDEAADDPDLELEDKELASDALARLLVKQGHVDRAIAMYKVLMLKNPQKSSFFAAQIEKLKPS